MLALIELGYHLMQLIQDLYYFLISDLSLLMAQDKRGPKCIMYFDGCKTITLEVQLSFDCHLQSGANVTMILRGNVSLLVCAVSVMYSKLKFNIWLCNMHWLVQFRSHFYVGHSLLRQRVHSCTRDNITADRSYIHCINIRVLVLECWVDLRNGYQWRSCVMGVCSLPLIFGISTSYVIPRAMHFHHSLERYLSAFYSLQLMIFTVSVTFLVLIIVENHRFWPPFKRCSL